MTNTRQLPHSEDLEKALLSSIRYRPDILQEIHDVLRTDMFYIPAHALIFEAFATIAERSPLDAAGIDFLAVKNDLMTSQNWRRSVDYSSSAKSGIWFRPERVGVSTPME
jgi:replicative DNA helicase